MNKSAILGAALALGMSFAATSAFAEKTKSLHDQFTGQGYGTAGCGLGSVVFGDKPGMVQIVAVTVNNTGYQTIAISSGTSNCGESGKTARAKQFIEVNKVALENDLSRGAGESVVALSEMMGCRNTNFSMELRSQFVPGSTQDQLAAAAAKSCQL